MLYFTSLVFIFEPQAQLTQQLVDELKAHSYHGAKPRAEN